MKIGIVGAGGMGAVHARHYRHIDGVEVLLYDVITDRAVQLANTHDAVIAHAYEELIHRCDAIDICLPTDFHHEFALKAIAGGRAVFVEKPLAANLKEGAEIVNAADQAGVVLGVGHVVRFFPEFAKGHLLVKEGKVGTPAAARTRRGGGPPKQEWFLDIERSGGILVDLAVHDFDWLRWTLGEVSHVYARSVAVQRGNGPDYALTTLTFDSGAVAHVEATWMDPAGFRCTFEVCGSEGMIQYDSRQTPTLRTHKPGPIRAEAPLAASDDPYFKQLSAFVAACRGEGELAVTGYDGFMAMSIALAALESAKTGKVVSPAREL